MSQTTTEHFRNSTSNRRAMLFSYFIKALEELHEGVAKSTTQLQIDGTIKRFELCYELAWKLIREVLEDKGIICRNPRDCFKQAILNELIASEEDWLKMLEDRNLLVHTYGIEASRELFERIKENYVHLFEELQKNMGAQDV